jgi:outer membrane protein
VTRAAIASAILATLAGPALPAAALAAGVDTGVPARLSLDAALRIARQHQPQLRQARANTAAADARVAGARAPLLPQVTANGSYTRSTANVAPRADLPMFSSPSPSFDTFNFFTTGITASQLIWDFGQSSRRRDAAEAAAESQERTEKATGLGADLNVRTAFFNANTARSAVDVARETLANQNRHLKQTEAFVELGSHPPIELMQAQADQANAEVQLINAQNDYATARALLNQTMGVEAPISYEIEPTASTPIPDEGAPLETLVEQGVAARPEIAAMRDQLRAQELTNKATYGRYFPSIRAGAGATYAGRDVNQLVWNLNGGLSLNWPIIEGGAVKAALREGEANVAALQAQVDTLRLQVRVEVEQASLAVAAAKAALTASDRSLTSARARLDLAEVRYNTGVGNGIELGDAQLAATNAAFQKLQAQLRLDTARAQLTKALARP